MRVIGAMVLLLVLGGVASPSLAGNASTTTLDTKATIEGTCASFGSAKTDLHSCDAKVFYEHYSNRRAAFVVQKTFSDLDERNDPTGEYKVGRRIVARFIGGEDQQQSATDYYLFIDQLAITLYDNEGTPLGSNQVNASGDCHLTGDTSMMHISRIVCSSRSGPAGRTSAMGFDFTGDGTPVEISYPFPPAPNNTGRGAAGVQQLDPNRPIGKFWIK